MPTSRPSPAARHPGAARYPLGPLRSRFANSAKDFSLLLLFDLLRWSNVLQISDPLGHPQVNPKYPLGRTAPKLYKLIPPQYSWTP